MRADPIDSSQQLLLKSFTALTSACKDFEGDLSVFKELEETLVQLPEYEGTLEDKITVLNAQLVSTIPGGLSNLKERIKELKEKQQKIRERYEFITNDFLLKE